MGREWFPARRLRACVIVADFASLCGMRYPIPGWYFLTLSAACRGRSVFAELRPEGFRSTPLGRLAERACKIMKRISGFQRRHFFGRCADGLKYDRYSSFFFVKITDRKRDPFSLLINPYDHKLSGLAVVCNPFRLHIHQIDVFGKAFRLYDTIHLFPPQILN